MNSSVLQFYDNCTIQLVDRSSQSPLWEISTGPPLSDQITTAESGLNYLIYPLNGDEDMNGNGTELWEVYNGNNVVCFSQALCLSEFFLVQMFVSHPCLYSCRCFRGNWRNLLPEVHTCGILLLLLDQKLQLFL